MQQRYKSNHELYMNFTVFWRLVHHDAQVQMFLEPSSTLKSPFVLPTFEIWLYSS